MKITLAVILLLLAIPSLAKPSLKPVTNAIRLSVAPTLDGDVRNDEAWHGGSALTDFWQVRPVAGAPASQKSEVYIGFTEDTLYIGAVLYDDSVEGILVTDARRDSSLDDTDSFQIVLDTYRDSQNGMVFGTNPAGIEYDGQVTKGGTSNFGSGDGGFNLNWDTNWEVKTKVNKDGWSLEMAIPFNSLRFSRSTTQTWGVNVQRNIRRNNEIVYWAPLGIQYNLYRVADAGALQGIEVPDQRNLKFTPYALGKSVQGGGLKDDTDSELGFDVKYSLTPSLTLDATYNTDFAQVETDEIQVNLDRFSIFLPEQRPFFLENADSFNVGQARAVQLFFSRRIGIGPKGNAIPIVGGFRVSGKIGDRTNVGFLQMRSKAVTGIAPENDFTVARISREYSNRSNLGFIFVNRDGDGSVNGNEGDDYNRSFAVDGKLGIGENTNISGFLAKTKTPGRDGKDHALRILADYNSNNWTSRASYSEVGDDFNPEVGFLTRKNFRSLQLFALRRIRPKNFYGIHELRPHIAYNTFRTFDGFKSTTFIHADNHWEWKNGYEIHTGMNFFQQGVQKPFQIAPGVTVPIGNYDDKEFALVIMTDQSAALSLNLGIRDGGLFGGDRFSIKPSIKYRIGDAFTSELSWNHNEVDLGPNGDFTIDVAQLRMTYSFTPKMTLQALVQYDKLNDVVGTNLRFSWLVTGDTGLYVVYNEVDDGRLGISEPRKELIIKFSYLFDVFK